MANKDHALEDDLVVPKMWRLALGILGALILCFAHPMERPYLSMLAASIGMGLFFYAIAFESKKGRFFWGFLFYALTFGVTFSWFATTTYHGYFILIAYGALLILFSGQFGLLCTLVEKRQFTFSRLFAIAATWTLLEWARLFLFSGFSFHPLGVLLSSHTLSLQLASVFGVYGLSFAVIFTNLLFAKVCIEKRGMVLPAFAFSMLFPYLFGALALSFSQDKREAKPPYRVAIVQTGTPIEQKYIIAGQKAHFIDPLTQWEGYFQLMKGQIKAPVDFIVFPEAVSLFAAYDIAFPLSAIEKGLVEAFGEKIKAAYPPLNDERFYSVYEEEVFVSNAFIGQVLAKAFDARVIMGLDLYEGKINYSAALEFTKEGNIQVYHKQVLLPIAEYLPFSFLEKLAAKYGIAGFFSPGKGGQLFVGEPIVAPSICYDECFGERLRRGALKGASLLISLSNDGWFPKSDLPWQHLLHGRIRAIEMGIPMIRACNTGVSAMIDPFGNVLSKMEERGANGEMQRGVLQGDLSRFTLATPYRLWGDFAIIGLSTIVIVIEGLMAYFNSKKWKKITIE